MGQDASKDKGLNPLKRVNSILTICLRRTGLGKSRVSQSPQTGQFNSYDDYDERIDKVLKSQSPQTGQFNSYGKDSVGSGKGNWDCLNPLKRVNSILTLRLLSFFKK